MQTVSTTDMQNRLTSVLDMAQQEPVVIEREGLPALVLSSMQTFQEKNKKSREEFIALCDDMRETAMRNGMTEEILNEILSDR